MSEGPAVTRRGFLSSGAALGSAAAVPARAGTGVPATPNTGAGANPNADPETLHWLDGTPPALHAGLAFGWPWPRGRQRKTSAFHLRAPDGTRHALQTWPLATWPDGSLKWSGHALPPGTVPQAGWRIEPGEAPAAATLRVEESADAVVVDTGLIRCTVPRRGPVLVARVERGGVEILRRGRLVALADDAPEPEGTARRRRRFEGEVESLVIEQRGPLRAVLRLQGRHRGEGRDWLPFDLRLVLHAGGDALRLAHSFVFDGEPARDFLAGVGLAFDVPLRDAPHDRHVRLAGELPGLFAECVRGLTGLRRDPGAAVRAAQLEGRACPPVDTFHPSVRKYLERIPAWGDVTLTQMAPDAFQIRKRTQAGQAWVHAAWGSRAAGFGWLGGPSGGVGFGLNDFWQRHPTQIDVRNAHTDTATVTLWMLGPDAPAQDMRPYHDGLGQDTHEKQLQGLEVTYEDWEPGFDSATGVGRSSEITLFALAATPRRERLVQLAALVQTPPRPMAAPARFRACGVYPHLWSLPERSNPARAALEDRLDFLFDYYLGQQQQRRWTGFWDWGDVRHTYDADRHEWRYDVGGYAWDNSELSPDLWLWSAFLRSGRADVFRFAEAMVRHTTEVDTYHLGRFQGLGTRHGVQHWSDSAKQLRISTAAYRRLYHYLTADERIGDVLQQLTTADRALLALDPARKIVPRPVAPAGHGLIGVGTDWSALLAAWLTAWERTGDARWRDRILRGMESVAAMPHGFFSAATAGYDPATGAFVNVNGQKVAASHLSAVFGLVEVMAELLDLLDVPGFERAWLQYCRLYNAPVDEQRREIGAPHGGTNALRVGHSRLTAYAAWRLRDPALARRAWGEFFSERGAPPLRTQRISGPAVLRPVDEAPWVSTNDAAQWSLAAIQNLALIGEHLPER